MLKTKQSITLLLIILFVTAALAYKPCKHTYSPNTFKKVTYSGTTFKHHFSITLPDDLTEHENIAHMTYSNEFPCTVHEHTIGLHIQISSATFYSPMEGSIGIHAAAQRALHSQILNIDTLFHKEKLANGDYLFIDKYCSDESYKYTLLKEKEGEFIIAQASSNQKKDTLILKILQSVQFIGTPKLKIPLHTYTHNNLYSILLPDSTKTRFDTLFSNPQIEHKHTIPNRIVDEITIKIDNINNIKLPVNPKNFFRQGGIWDKEDVDSTLVETATRYVFNKKTDDEYYKVYACTQTPAGSWLTAEIATQKEFQETADSIAKSFKGLRKKISASKIIPLPFNKGLTYSDIHPNPTKDEKYITTHLVQREYKESDSLTFTLLMPETLLPSNDMFDFTYKREDLAKFYIDFTSGWGYPFGEYGTMEEEDKARLETEFKNRNGDHIIYYKAVSGYMQVDIYPLIDGSNKKTKISIVAPAHLKEIIRTMAETVTHKKV